MFAFTDYGYQTIALAAMDEPEIDPTDSDFDDEHWDATMAEENNE